MEERRKGLDDLLKRGDKACRGYEHTWRELRELIQEETRLAMAEWKRLVDLRLVITAEQEMMLQTALFDALRQAITNDTIQGALREKPDDPARQLLQGFMALYVGLLPKDGVGTVLPSEVVGVTVDDPVH